MLSNIFYDAKAHILGKVIIIHDSPDDFTNQPGGKFGTKIACGKIE